MDIDYRIERDLKIKRLKIAEKEINIHIRTQSVLIKTTNLVLTKCLEIELNEF